MALFQMRWLRRLVRRNTNPIPIDKATLWKNRLSIFYMLVSWNAFGLVCYMVYSGKNDWAKYHGLKTEEDEKLGPGYHWAKQLKIEKATVIRYRGMEKIQESEIDNRVKDVKN